MQLNEQVKSQIGVLTERVKNLKATIRRVDYMLAASGFIALLTYFFPKTLSLKISSLDIPSSLFVIESSGVSGRLGALSAGGFESVSSVLLEFISSVAPIVAVGSMLMGVFFIIKGNMGSGIQVLFTGAIMFSAPSIVSGLLGSQPGESTEQHYKNDAVIRSIVNFDMSEPISHDYIGKVDGVAQRYVLAQAAILSDAGYPSSYFKSLAGDLAKQSSFLPTEKALYSIEMAAYGHPESEAIVERVNTLNGYGKVAGAINFVAQMLFVMLFLGGSALKLLRMSINKRLKAITQLVASSQAQDKGEVA
ncbi:hypothetical protein E4188_22595 (plasmid) [Aeromonas media]|uniref:ABC transporter permease n=1 Tax=Aeromonas media TaxID=651 RepID=A0ABX6P0V6_AERME|nr:hypothetical protein [Aeromonas media]QJT37106.1 hypothetical protein E4187_22725 [Aeromonas media]QJT41290.1 hypothetical protein E4188_22595 [Aeromonas media]